jgi:hypothetical protein
LGKFVTAKIKADDGTERDVSGIVTGVRFDTDGSAVLELDTGEAIPAQSVTRITTAENSGRKPVSTTPATPAASTNATTATTSAPSTTNTAAATDKATDAAKTADGGVLPWLSFDAGIHL